MIDVEIDCSKAFRCTGKSNLWAHEQRVDCSNMCAGNCREVSNQRLPSIKRLTTGTFQEVPIRGAVGAVTDLMEPRSVAKRTFMPAVCVSRCFLPNDN